MRRKTFVMVLSMFLALSLLVVGCGGGGEKVEPTKKPDDKKMLIMMVTDEGGINDESFNQSTWEGLEKLEKEFPEKIEVRYLESKQQTDFARNLEQSVANGAAIICGVGHKMTQALEDAARANPEILYIGVDIDYAGEGPKNALTVNFKAEEGSFLVGYIAAKASKSKKVGFVGGMDFPVINGFEYGYKAGATYADKNIEISSQYIGDFNDSAKGKAIATQFFSKGADVVYHAAGDAGKGVIEAAKEQGAGKWAIGVDMDQHALAPQSVLTSAMKEVGTGMYKVIKEYMETGTFRGGENIVYGLKEGGVGIAPTSDINVPAEILAEVEKIEKDIIDGKIVVPSTKEGFDKFVQELN